MRHSSDNEPGYSRKRMGRYWAYFDENEKRVADRETIERLNSIGLPPAYRHAWFCKDPNGHLQATGMDVRGRKQYRYHPDFRARADKKKFTGLLEFARALPKLRRSVDRDLRKRTLSREKVLAAVVRLLDTEYLRVGNERYARENKSFGATTLLGRHVRSDRGKVKMRFKAKHGIVHEVVVTDRRLGRIVRQCADLPGQALFQYINGEGVPHPITSADVNDYIRETAGDDYTAKHFRTWGACVIAFDKMLEAAEDARKVSVTTIVEPVAEALGNTLAMSRKSYVHPKLIEAIKENPLNPLGNIERPPERKWLSSAEVALCKFLSTNAAA
ncbi:MAG TPA: DNA topoisomerase IB [Sphingomicrobium sp.]|nr:DNA topoisomerase IB [Sphingomicrobium sp.]